MAAVGVSDERSGQAIKLFVVRRTPDLTAQALIEFCRTKLTPYKVPRVVEFRDELPRPMWARSFGAPCGRWVTDVEHLAVCQTHEASRQRGKRHCDDAKVKKR